MPPTPLKLKPLHRNELFLTAESFEVAVDLQFSEKGAAQTEADFVSVAVPKQVREANRKQVGVKNDILLFFTSNGVIGDKRQNDILIHGLRAAGQDTGFVTIGIPARGEDPAAHQPDFCAFRQQDIEDCLEKVDLSKSIGNIRIASHSRGHRGMTRTLLGNDDIAEKLDNARFKDPFIEVAKLDKLIYLDNFYLSGKRAVAHLVTAKGLPRTALSVYFATDGVFPDTSVMQNLKQQLITLALPSKKIPYEATPAHLRMAAAGAMRFIDGGFDVDGATTLNASFQTTVSSNPDILKLLVANPVPPRGTLSTHKPTPSNAEDYVDFVNSIKVDPAQTQRLLQFLNDQDVLRAKVGKVAPDGEFWGHVAAHHFFVCELAHELYE